MIKCENGLCVYFEACHCILDEIEINIFGMCEACILIIFDEQDLQQKRQQCLQQLENE